MIKTVLSLDIGTTSLKAGLITAKGEVVFICRKGIPEKDSRYVPQFWFNCLEAACKKLQLKLNSMAEEVEICGISVSGNGPTVVTQEGLVYKWNEELSDEKLNSVAGGGGLSSLLKPPCGNYESTGSGIGESCFNCVHAQKSGGFFIGCDYENTKEFYDLFKKNKDRENTLFLIHFMIP